MRTRGALFLVVSIGALPVWSSEPGGPLDCVAAMAQANSAMTVRDFPMLERLARRVIEACHEKTDGQGHGSLALALNFLGRHQEAFETAQRCLEINYQNPVCHEERVFAVSRLHRRNEALDACRVGIQVAQEGIRVRDEKMQLEDSALIEKESPLVRTPEASVTAVAGGIRMLLENDLGWYRTVLQQMKTTCAALEPSRK